MGGGRAMPRGKLVMRNHVAAKIVYDVVSTNAVPMIFLLVPYRCFTGGNFRFTHRPCVRLSDCPSVRPQNPDSAIT